MGPELLIAIIGPILGGSISLIVWVNKQNSEHIEKGFEKMSENIQRVERKVEDMRVDVAKNYATNDDLMSHIKVDESWQVSIQDEVTGIRADIRDIRMIVDRIRFEQ